MPDLKNLTGDDFNNPKVLVEAMNGILKEYRDAIANRSTKEDTEKLSAKLIVKSNEIAENITANGAIFDDIKKQAKDLAETVKVQGATITKMKTAFEPGSERKSFQGELTKGLMSKEFQAFTKGETSKASFNIETKEIDFTEAIVGVGAGTMQPVMPFNVPQGPRMENFDVRILLPTGNIESSSLEYPTELASGLSDTTAAAAENGASTESNIDFTMGTAFATRITTWISISRSALQNASWLNGYVQNRLMQMFIKELNTQSIAGAGSGAGMVAANDLKGLDAFANTFAGTNFASKIANANNFDVLNCAKGEMNGLYNYVANTYLLNPYSGTILTSSKNTISDFIMPATFLQPNGIGYTGSFGMRQVETKDIVVGEYLAAEIAPSNMQLLFNGPIEILATDAHASTFLADKITLKIEGKVMLPVYNANALMKGVFATDLNTIMAGA